MMAIPYSSKSPRLLIVVIIVLSVTLIWLVSARQIETASAQAIGSNTSFRNFEAPQVHPLALTPSGKHLLAVNSPNASLSVFELSSGTPVLSAEIPVGLEPVSVAARTDREVWVVNWLSDSVSIVDLTTGNVVRTIDVGDEPTDILFAGPNGQRAFVCVSGGGLQTVSGNSVTGGNGAVKVWDTTNLDAAPQLINISAKQPRALARDTSGGQVFVSVFESGNQTTIVPQPLVAQNGGLPAPNPAMRSALPAAPNTALIVKWNGSAWADETGDAKWDPLVTYTLADIDLVTIDANATNPAITAQTRGLGTNLGNMAFDPVTAQLFVANVEAGSVRRFEPNLRGTFLSNRVSILNTTPGGAPALVSVSDINQHVDLNNPAGTDAERAQSLALPADITRAADGTLYLAATSSAKVGFLNSSGATLGRISVGQGPTGLALDETRQRLYVLNRFDQTVSVVNTDTKAQVSQVGIGLNPEPPSVRNGRRFLYDASFSAHGTVSCASCHPSGHRDGLAWDLGDPNGDMVTVGNFTHHPMKGPMMTQSLRGLLQSPPLHWRADRNNIAEFNVAFTGLLGSTRLLTADEMTAFSTFVETLAYPPNPNENLDRTFPSPSSGPNAAAGALLFQNFRGFHPIFLGNANNCNACHSSAPLVANRFQIGTSRLVFSGTILSEPQAFKTPQLRGIYQKIGLQKPAPGQTRTEQITGFGFMHDGAIDTLVNFMKNPQFIGFNNDNERRDIEAFLMSFDSVMAPAVGLQVTVNAANKNSAQVLGRINLLVQQAQPVPIPGNLFPAAPNCDLVVRGIYDGAPRAFLQLGNGIFKPDSGSEANVTLQQLLDAVADGAELTFTGVPEGEGRRYSIDSNSNGVLNDDEVHTSVQLSGRVVDAAGNGIAGVSVSLSGTQSRSAVTDASGSYVFNFVSTTGVHTVTPQRVGLTFAPVNRSFSNPTWNQSATFVTSPTGNLSEVSPFFVSQHFADFLNRAPDPAGLQFWTDQIESCGADANCRSVRRNNVSGAFFLSIEFRESGYLVYRVYKSSFGDLPGKPVPLNYQQLMIDTERLGRNVIVNVSNWQQQMETNKQAFFAGWVQRSDFTARYPAAMSPAGFVDALNANTGGSLSSSERDALVSQLTTNNTTTGRASVVRQIAENAEFSRRQLNRAFVLMQYFGYLRRNPDDAPEAGLNFDGFNFWLTKLEQNNGNFIQAEMVKAFITSGEYRQRFGP